MWKLRSKFYKNCEIFLNFTVPKKILRKRLEYIDVKSRGIQPLVGIQRFIEKVVFLGFSIFWDGSEIFWEN